VTAQTLDSARRANAAVLALTALIAAVTGLSVAVPSGDVGAGFGAAALSAIAGLMLGGWISSRSVLAR
jgi:hypothetical protein